MCCECRVVIHWRGNLSGLFNRTNCLPRQQPRWTLSKTASVRLASDFTTRIQRTYSLMRGFMGAVRGLSIGLTAFLVNSSSTTHLPFTHANIKQRETYYLKIYRHLHTLTRWSLVERTKTTNLCLLFRTFCSREHESLLIFFL